MSFSEQPLLIAPEFFQALIYIAIADLNPVVDLAPGHYCRLCFFPNSIRALERV